MQSDPPPERHVARWFGKAPDLIAFALLCWIAHFAWSTEQRLTRVETRIESIAEQVGVGDERQARR
jgi:hypothetical protein